MAETDVYELSINHFFFMLRNILSSEMQHPGPLAFKKISLSKKSKRVVKKIKIFL